MLYLEHGKPMIFGKDRNKGIRLNGLDPEVVELGKDVPLDDLLIHDETAEEPTLAYLLSRFAHDTGTERNQPVPGAGRRFPDHPQADLRRIARRPHRRHHRQEGQGQDRGTIQGRGCLDRRMSAQ